MELDAVRPSAFIVDRMEISRETWTWCLLFTPHLGQTHLMCHQDPGPPNHYSQHYTVKLVFRLYSSFLNQYLMKSCETKHFIF